MSVLLVSSKKEPGNWIFPKGHVEPGETAREAALRETEEEAGVDGDLLGPVGALEFDWRGKRYRVQYFLIRATPRRRRPTAARRSWLPFDDALARLTYPETQAAAPRRAAQDGLMAPEIEIYDTTLRDGTQGHGISFSVADKLRIAERLDAFGVHYIEGGWPGSNPKDIEFFAEAKHRTFTHARLAAFGSTRRKDVAAAADDQVQLLIDAGTPVVTIFGKTSLLHVREVLQTTPEENLAMIADTVRFLKQHGRFVVYDAEHAFDGFKDDRGVRAGDAGRPPKRPAPTSSCCATPTADRCRPRSRRSRARRAQRCACRIGIHTHDDIGLGVANALAAHRGRRDARAGHDQRLRRAHRQLQPDDGDPEPALQAEEARRCRPSRCRC